MIIVIEFIQSSCSIFDCVAIAIIPGLFKSVFKFDLRALIKKTDTA